MSGRQKWQEVTSVAILTIVIASEQDRRERKEVFGSIFTLVENKLEEIMDVICLLESDGGVVGGIRQISRVGEVQKRFDEQVETYRWIVADGHCRKRLWSLDNNCNGRLCGIGEVGDDRLYNKEEHYAGEDQCAANPEETIMNWMAARDTRNSMGWCVQAEISDDGPTSRKLWAGFQSFGIDRKYASHLSNGSVCHFDVE